MIELFQSFYAPNKKSLGFGQWAFTFGHMFAIPFGFKLPWLHNWASPVEVGPQASRPFMCSRQPFIVISELTAVAFKKKAFGKGC